MPNSIPVGVMLGASTIRPTLSRTRTGTCACAGNDHLNAPMGLRRD